MLKIFFSNGRLILVMMFCSGLVFFETEDFKFLMVKYLPLRISCFVLCFKRLSSLQHYFLNKLLFFSDACKILDPSGVYFGVELVVNPASFFSSKSCYY